VLPRDPSAVSAHIVSSDKMYPAIVITTCCNLSSQYIVSEILAVARELKHSAYSKVYLSKDRTPEERERRKKCVVELKKMGNRGTWVEL